MVHTDLLVLGGGPGGYTAAFRAADLGLNVTLVERHETLGGVCLNVGCIPSKALLHVAKVIAHAERAAEYGVAFSPPAIDLAVLRDWRDGVIGRLTSGLTGMAKQRGVAIIRGTGALTGPNTLDCDGQQITFERAILATGSRAVRLPDIPYGDPRVMGSTDALALAAVPARLLVLGGGIIGLELATVYDALGAQVTVVEFAEQLMPGCDADLLVPLRRRISGRYNAIHTGTRVETMIPHEDGIHVTFAPSGTSQDTTAPAPEVFDRVLVAVGRVPNSDSLGLERAGIGVDERGFVMVDGQLRTSTPQIHAVGDLVGGPLLAHKATHEAKVAAEVAAGQDLELDVRGIPSVAYTEPEVAWVGLNEVAAKAQGVPYRAVTFPWAASGRALASSASGMTKLLVDPGSSRLLGAGIVGDGAGELIAEPTLALELEVDTEDIARTIHAHPTLAETVALAAEVAEGTITDLPPVKTTTSP
jgi:dihydrolipoamide dehydrogenase